MDNLNQIGKGLGKNKKTGDRGLNVNRPIIPQIERVRDTMDFTIPFTMHYKIEADKSRVSLDLLFLPPPKTGCCAGCECSVCEFFAGGFTETELQLTYGYIPGTVHGFKTDGGEVTYLVETDPPRGIITSWVHNSDDLIVCYVYDTCL